MFKSKPIGWITAATLLCVAGVALACRLKEGSGQAVRASAVALADGDKKDPPREVAPGPLPAALVPVPLPAAPDPGPASEMKTEATPPPLPVESVPPPASLNATIAAPAPPTETIPPPPSGDPLPAPKESVIAPVAPPIPEKKADVTPLSPLPPGPGLESKADSGTVHLPAPPLPTADKLPKVDVVPVSEPRVVESTITPTPVATQPKEPVKELAPTPTGNKPYWAAQGDTLREIARKSLGNGERWREIEKLNPELRAGTVIPAGTMVRLPGDAQQSAIVTVSNQVETEPATKASPTAVKPLPVIRARQEGISGVVAMTGSFACKLDAQHGLVLPKDVCEQMGKCETMMLTPGPDRCLWLVSEAGARRMLHRIEKAQVDDAVVQAFKRIYFSQTEKSTVDATGSFKVPATLADYAGLTGEVVLIGMDDHFELWSAARWHQYSQQKSSTSKNSHSADE